MGEGLGEVAQLAAVRRVPHLRTSFARVTDAVEVGTFKGTSALCVDRGLAPGGRLLCCDVNEEWTAIAREAWTEAGMADRVELRIAPAIETLRTLPPLR